MTDAGEDDRERELRRATEALLLVTEEPIAAELLAQLLEVGADRVEALCVELAAEYDATDRGFQLVKVAGGWRYQTHPDLAPYVERYVLDGQSGRLSNAALETLAIVAYKQPISRAQIAAIRGVNVDGVIRTLVQRGYVDEIGRDHGPGQAVLYGTTATFLEKLGLNAIDELPALGAFVPGADVYEALEQGLRPDPLDSDIGAPVDEDEPEHVSADEPAGDDATG
jgi:segregation and condensation protein B